MAALSDNAVLRNELDLLEVSISQAVFMKGLSLNM